MPLPDSQDIWLADLTYTQQTVAADTIPFAIGGIAAYTEQRLRLKNPIRLFKYPEFLARALSKGETPWLIGLSNYVWNGSLSYEFAKAIKKINPGTVVVLGGPNYPCEPEAQVQFLRDHPAIDFVVIKEGETVFSALVSALMEEGESLQSVRCRKLPSLHFIDDRGEPVLTEPAPRISDLSEIPSAYLSGKMDEFFDGKLLPVIQTNRGCPFGCTFCVEGDEYYSRIRRSRQERVRAEIDYIGAKMRATRDKGGRNDLFISDSNFGMYAEDRDTALALADARRRYGWPEYINVATGKNHKKRVLEVSRILEGALRLSGSVQSLDPGVLENIRRKNIDAQELFALGLDAEETGANTYSEIILALPGDSLTAHYGTIRTVMAAGFTNIYLFQLMLLPGTELASTRSKIRHGMVTQYRVLPRCFGRYTVHGDQLAAAEIEEICVANSTLPFDDYLAARRLHLIITIFYNDGAFAALVKLLRALGLTVFRWMELLASTPPPPPLEPLFDSFLEATKAELWGSRGALEAYLRRPGVIERYIEGELGSNLLFRHKTLAVTTFLPALAEFTRETFLQCLREANRLTPQLESFVNDAVRYHHLRSSNLFTNIESTPRAAFQYDVGRYLAAPRDAKIEGFRLAAPVSFRFTLNDSQRELIERYIRIYGGSPVSIGRIFSKVHVRKLFRDGIAEQG